jgi:hypothetical protein
MVCIQYLKLAAQVIVDPETGLTFWIHKITDKDASPVFPTIYVITEDDVISISFYQRLDYWQTGCLVIGVKYKIESLSGMPSPSTSLEIMLIRDW